MKRARLVAVVALLSGALATAGALAAPDDRTPTEAALRDVEASPRKSAAAEMVARSKAATERAGQLRASGDEAHARIADTVARTWAEAAREVVRAADLEEKAAAARRGATDAGVAADRERALLEEAIAQSGRLRAQLDSESRDGKDQQPARTNVAGANSDAGKKPAPQPNVTKGGAKDGGAR